MVEERRVERLTASDLFLLLWDDYGWSTDIGGLAILDGARLLDDDGRVRLDMIRRHVEPRLHLVPRFRQLLSRPRLGLGWPLWVDAPTFVLADHIRVHTVAPPGGQAQLLEACQQLARRPFDPSRASVGAVAAARTARPTSRRLLEAASRPRRRPRGDGRVRRAAR
jgi:hypothetical protein